MSIFVIADLHFGHKNIIDVEERPFKTTDEMDYNIIKNWNSVVKEDDTVYVLGDVSFHDEKETLRIINSLNGKKNLIMGNHDTIFSPRKWMELGFKEVSSNPIILDEFLILSHEPPTYFNDKTPYFYIFGHVHSCKLYPTITEKSACVSVERWDYTPVDINTIRKTVSRKEF